jgi:2-polyprenyl-6-hydroxyphenyl methylase/3-demethylubiquinone-9 3-methyltransferase
MGEDKVTFSFGKNWQKFLETNFSDERVQVSRAHLLEFLGLPDLKGKCFLDIGCGSGLHSLAASRSGASRVVGIDVDPYSVETSKRMRERSGIFPAWEVLHGSILDDDFVAKIESADIVYSWGVLHHTGDLWKAIRNAASLVREGGLFYIAIYEKTEKSDYWFALKKKYNRASPIRKRAMELSYVYRNFIADRAPRYVLESIRYMKDYRKIRGMEFWTDIRDWLGGWPYEPATPAEMTGFCEGVLGLRTVKIKTGEANIEYLFSRGGESGSTDRR